MFETPCSVSIDERAYQDRLANEQFIGGKIDSAKDEFISARVTELAKNSPYDCFLECDDDAEMALKAIASAQGTPDLLAAKDQLSSVIIHGANIIAERDWKSREAMIVFDIMEQIRNGTWWDDQ